MKPKWNTEINNHIQRAEGASEVGNDQLLKAALRSTQRIRRRK